MTAWTLHFSVTRLMHALRMLPNTKMRVLRYRPLWDDSWSATVPSVVATGCSH